MKEIVTQTVIDAAPAAVTETCPLCGMAGGSFYKTLFFACGECRAVFRPPESYPSPEAEKKRYMTHNNDVRDAGYRKFVSPITSAVMRSFSREHSGLDFGAGTGPVISKILGDAGYNIKLYDPFFHDFPGLLTEEYDYIVCCEVIEHFHDPAKEFNLLRKILRPGGRLYCMTDLFAPEIDFDKWYYKDDFTHTIFYEVRTLEWIRNTYGFSSHKIEGRLIEFAG